MRSLLKKLIGGGITRTIIISFFATLACVGVVKASTTIGDTIKIGTTLSNKTGEMLVIGENGGFAIEEKMLTEFAVTPVVYTGGTLTAGTTKWYRATRCKDRPYTDATVERCLDETKATTEQACVIPNPNPLGYNACKIEWKTEGTGKYKIYGDTQGSQSKSILLGDIEIANANDSTQGCAAVETTCKGGGKRWHKILGNETWTTGVTPPETTSLYQLSTFTNVMSGPPSYNLLTRGELYVNDGGIDVWGVGICGGNPAGFYTGVMGKTHDILSVERMGTFSWGDGDVDATVTLYHPSANTLKITRFRDGANIYDCGDGAQGAGDGDLIIDGNLLITPVDDSVTAASTNAKLKVVSTGETAYTNLYGSTVKNGATALQTTFSSAPASSTAHYGSSSETVFNWSSAPSAISVGDYVSVTMPSSNSATLGQAFYGQYIDAKSDKDSGSLNRWVGQKIVSDWSGTGTINTGLYGGWDVINNTSTATVRDAYAHYVELSNSGGVYTNSYGYYSGDMSSGNQTNLPYSFYSSDNKSLNYFAGSVGIGTSASTSVTGSGDIDLVNNGSSDTIEYATGNFTTLGCVVNGVVKISGVASTHNITTAITAMTDTALTIGNAFDITLNDQSAKIECASDGGLALSNGAKINPAVANTVQLSAKDATGAVATIAINAEATVSTETITCGHTFPIFINGTEYKLCLQ